MDYKTCTHTYDSGRACKSAAAKGREFCGYHLHYRGRLLRRAQFRARNQPFDITLPPLDSLCSIQSALSQVAEALAADMIDPRRAMGLLKALRFAKENLKDGLKDDSAHWHDTPYLTQDAAAYDNFEAEYGLPKGLALNVLPEVTFPSPPVPAASETSHWPPATDHSSNLSPMPTAGYCSEHGYDCPDLVIRADHPVTPEMIEINEISETQGSDAAARRGNQLERNRQRRGLRYDRKRYAAIALEKNMRIAAQKLAEQKLAADRAAAQRVAPESNETKKPPASTIRESAAATEQETQSIA
jgi:hypothetical protein